MSTKSVYVRITMRRNFLSILKWCIIVTVTSVITAIVFYTNKSIYMALKSSRQTGLLQVPNRHKMHSVGEHGKAVILNETQKVDYNYDRLFNENGFNAALSDLISVNRSIPDIRHYKCHKKNYSRDLLPVSVIIPYHNEHKSTLLRTVYSVLNRAPNELINEVILVNDCSSKKFNIELTNKVKIINLPSRQGLIRARLAGAKIATAPILVFLDSHVEANKDWLVPLIDPVTKDYRICTCPFIDVIAYDTFEYRAQDEGARGAFDWEMYYKRLPLLPESTKHPSEPFESPIMAGGLFAISAKFFWELGGYDDQLEIWGGEQYELSFKIWQCGGKIIDIPCSRLGHIYRKFSPFLNAGKGDFLAKNLKRVAEVWMDEYAEYLYKRKPHYRDIDAGDLTNQKELRKKLQCKPFKWFMEQVAFDLPKKYPPIEPDNIANGTIRSENNPQICLDAINGNENSLPRIWSCQRDNEEQQFVLSWKNDIRLAKRSMCLDVSRSGPKAPVVLFPCHGGQGNQFWAYDKVKHWLIHGVYKRCLEYDGSNVFVTKCRDNNRKQKWIFN